MTSAAASVGCGLAPAFRSRAADLGAETALGSLVELCAAASDPEDLLERGAGPLTALLRPHPVLVVSSGPRGPVELGTASGLPLDGLEMRSLPAVTVQRATAVTRPARWETWGVVRVDGWLLRAPAEDGTEDQRRWLVVGRRARGPLPPIAAAGIALLTQTAARLATESRHERLRRRVEDAQDFGGMGEFDWHLPSDTVTWSDELFRVFGHRPGSFVPTYGHVLDQIHPDDRDRVQRLHQHAYATGEPWSSTERIVRPTGEVRLLASRGVVVMDGDRVPLRMRGVCVDITDGVAPGR